MHELIDVDILRVYMGESARHDGRPLYEAVIEAARARGLAGATVTRGVMGFGGASLVHTAKILRLSEDLPVIVDIVDTPGRVAAFLPELDAMLGEGLYAIQPARAAFHVPLRVRDIMSVDLVTADPDMPLSAVVERLVRRGVKALPVVEGKRVKGVVTGGDLLTRGRMALRLDIQGQLPDKLREPLFRDLDATGLTARDIMSAPARTIGLSATIPEALSLMARKNCKRLPVVNDRGELVGLVSRVDVLKTVARAAAIPTALPALPPGVKRTAGDIMIGDVPTAEPDTPLAEVLRRLVASPLRRVVILDRTGPQPGRVVGIVHDRELVERLAAGARHGLLGALLSFLAHPAESLEPLTGRADEVMNRVVRGVTPETPLAEVIERMVALKVRRLVVTDQDGRLLGMVDREAALRALGEGD